MIIGIHAQPSGGAPGGTDIVVAVLAEALSARHEVVIIHHGTDTTIESLAQFSGTDLSRVRLRTLPRVANDEGASHNPIRRYSEARDRSRHLSEPYDMFVTFTHEPPPFCHAPRGVLVVLFPMFAPYHRVESPIGSRGLWERARRAYASFEWHRRLATYDITVAISEFTREWIMRSWGVDAVIVYPPAEGDTSALEKSRLILSVGRFASSGHVKCQLEMVEAFSGLALPDWSYVSAGSLGGSPEDHAYTEAVGRAAEGLPITIAPNLDRAAVRDLYGQAKIFWHAAGFGNPESSPERNEHFGISTVEAMAAGCVPIVINKGGQPEIVEHGVSGFLWQSLDDLRTYTTEVANDQGLWRRMSEAARERAKRFDRRHYVDRFLEVLGPQLGANTQDALPRKVTASSAS